MESSSPSNATEVRAIRKWFLVALIFSLALHGALFEFFRSKQLAHFTFTNPAAERLVPRAFTVKKVTINEDLLKPAEPSEPKKPEPPKTVLQNEKPSAENLPSDVRFTPSAPPPGDLTRAFTAEKPSVAAGAIPQPASNVQVERELDSLKEQIGPKNAPKIVAGTGNALPDSAGAPDSTEIDQLLAQSGPLTGPVNPVHIADRPGGALFEYDSAALRPEAIETLRKLGLLIDRNPHSTFSIEGYTDAFGSPDYNLKLSRARADAVKAWLVKTMKLDPSRIQTKGFGSTRLITPATGTREEQAPNRRVEIVIRTPKN
ncbi:MAG: OmpA family protein [Verrucomicrobiota bacterium]